MSKFVTVTSNHGISMRPATSADKAGETKEGRLRVHGSRELACAQMDKFWLARGFKNMGAGR